MDVVGDRESPEWGRRRKGTTTTAAATDTTSGREAEAGGGGNHHCLREGGGGGGRGRWRVGTEGAMGMGGVNHVLNCSLKSIMKRCQKTILAL